METQERLTALLVCVTFLTDPKEVVMSDWYTRQQAETDADVAQICGYWIGAASARPDLEVKRFIEVTEMTMRPSVTNAFAICGQAHADQECDRNEAFVPNEYTDEAIDRAASRFSTSLDLAGVLVARCCESWMSLLYETTSMEGLS